MNTLPVHQQRTLSHLHRDQAAGATRSALAGVGGRKPDPGEGSRQERWAGRPRLPVDLRSEVWQALSSEAHRQTGLQGQRVGARAGPAAPFRGCHKPGDGRVLTSRGCTPVVGVRLE